MRGMTWNHPRGYDPLVAASRLWRDRTGIEIEWDRRSLQDFESYPVETLARAYDLIVIDHPHVGQIAAADCLMPFAGDLDEVATGSVGGSFESYLWEGRQWALPIDAAAQVQAWTPERLPGPIADWDMLADMAAEGCVGLPLLPPHSLMSLFTLCGLGGVELQAAGPDLFPAEAIAAYDRLIALVKDLDPGMFDLDPIGVLEAMAGGNSTLAVSPLIYGYVSYAAAGFRSQRIAFADIPAIGASGPSGSTLGGTGIAVSAYGRDPTAAAQFARWIASGTIQRDVIAAQGGQPAHDLAWRDDDVNAATGNFFRATRRSLDRAWVRPRHVGYMAFQDAASRRLNQGLRSGEPGDMVIDGLNALFRDSLSS